MDHKPFGLVLGGGGALGMAHVGVLRALNHLGYYPSVIVGVSMGAVVGATYSLNESWYQDLVDLDDTGFPVVPRFGPKIGIAERLRSLAIASREVQEVFFGWGAGQHTADWGRSIVAKLTRAKRLEEGRIPIHIAATDLMTGDRVVMSDGNAVDAVYASSALAGILPPFRDGDRLLIDGGYSDISPVDVVREAGVAHTVSVDPSQRRITREPRNGLDVFLRSIQVTQEALSRVRFKEADLVLSPDYPRSIGVLDFREKRACIAAGAVAVRKAARALAALLGPTQAGV